MRDENEIRLEHEKIAKTIISKLQEIGKVPGNNLAEQMNYRFLDAGHIDSISIINFIMEIEDAFQISLSPEDTQSDEFRTVSGLVSMVEKKMNG